MDVTVDTYPDRIEVRIPFDESITRLEGGGERVVDEDGDSWAVWKFASDADPQPSAEEAARLFKASIPVAAIDTTTVTVDV